MRSVLVVTTLAIKAVCSKDKSNLPRCHSSIFVVWLEHALAMVAKMTSGGPFEPQPFCTAVHPALCEASNGRDSKKAEFTVLMVFSGAVWGVCLSARSATGNYRVTKPFS